MLALGTDLRFAFRLLRRQPALTTVVTLTLMLGIGANTAIFSVVNGVLLRPLDFEKPEQLILLYESDGQGSRMYVSTPNFLDWREQSKSFEQMVAFGAGEAGILGGSEPVRAVSAMVTDGFFKMVRTEPILGRPLLPSDHEVDATPVAVISHAFWNRYLDASDDLTDVRLTLDGDSVAVVGVMPAGFGFPSGSDVWISGENFLEGGRDAHNNSLVARLKDGVTVSQARAEMGAIARRIKTVHPEKNDAESVAVVPLLDQMVGPVRPALLSLLGVVGFVLMIACANVSSLLLSRSNVRSTEMAIRSALGASKGRLLQQMLMESFLLTLVGGIAGVLLADWLIGLFRLWSPPNIPRLDEVIIDARVLLFTLGVCLVAALLTGLAPALQATSAEPYQQLRGGRSGSSSRARTRFLDSVFVAEVSLALVPLVGAGLMINSLGRLLSVDPGFNPENVLTMDLSLPRALYPEGHHLTRFYDELLGQMENQPGIEAAAVINNLPLASWDIGGTFLREDLPGEEGYAGYRVISAGYPASMEIPLLRGRFFASTDGPDTPDVALINRAMADEYWPGEDPIGKRILSTGMDPDRSLWEKPLTIVGVIDDVRHSQLSDEPQPELYVHNRQRPNRTRYMSAVIRTSGEAMASASGIRRLVRAIDADLPVTFAPMSSIVAGTVAKQRFNTLLTGALAGLAMLLAVVGIYGVISYAVAQRTREFSIRIALGAKRMDILRLVMGKGVWLTAIGLGIGLAGTLGLTGLLTSQLFGIEPTDPVTFLGVASLLATVALLACVVPARRATRIEPVESLRAE